MMDLRLAFRSLTRSPLFATIAIASLAIGIGANTAIFSVLNAIVLRALPVREPHELRMVNWTGANPRLTSFRSFGGQRMQGDRRISGSFPHPALHEFRSQAAELADVFAFAPLGRATVQTPGGAALADVLLVSGDFFPSYGTAMLVGRSFTSEEDHPGAAPAAVISHRLWERAFGRDAAVLDRTMTINGHAFTIIGVLPAGHVGPMPGDPTDVYVPFAAQPQLLPGYPLASADHWWVQVMARVHSGRDDGQTRVALAAAFARVLAGSNATMDRADILLEDGSRGAAMGRERFARPFWVLLAAVGLVLLIACANLAGLMLARGTAQRHEMAVRIAIGASRWRLVRRSLIESALLAGAGAAVGLLLASWGSAALMRIVTPSDNLHFDLRTDANVLLFTLGVAAVTILLFGLLPAWRASRVDPLEGLRTKSGIGGPRLRLGKTLVAAQVALSALLVVGAGLAVRSLAHLRQVEPGFNPQNLLLFSLYATQVGYTPVQQLEFLDRTRRALEAIPGVHAVAQSDTVLASGSRSSYGITIPGRDSEPGENTNAARLVVSDGYFATMGIPLVLGRDFTPGDATSAVAGAIVNEAFVRRYLDGTAPLERTVRMGRDYQIIGVCRDAKYDSLRSDIEPMVYVLPGRGTPGATTFLVRTTLPPLSLLPEVRQAIAALDPRIPLQGVNTQAAQIDQSLAAERLFAVLCSSLGVLALGLSCIGLFGLLAFAVARRTGEIGVRMAFGATGRDIAWPIVREALLITGLGLAVGVSAALALARVVQSKLFGVSAADPIAFGTGILLLLGIAALAAWLPARRAARVSPLVALRSE